MYNLWWWVKIRLYYLKEKNSKTRNHVQKGLKFLRLIFPNSLLTTLDNKLKILPSFFTIWILLFLIMLFTFFRYWKMSLTLPCQISLSYRNQLIDLLCKWIALFLYNRDLRQERVKRKPVFYAYCTLTNQNYWKLITKGSLIFWKDHFTESKIFSSMS